jgi:hypothetical protein
LISLIYVNTFNVPTSIKIILYICKELNYFKMGIKIVRHKDQVKGSFNNGAILENKPLGFPQDEGIQTAYSNLFYWAHAYTTEGSTIGLHPHRGFEIISYVLKGAIKHYDTKTDKWWDLEQGDLQVIKSGNGISHSEELGKYSEIFQIWLDPNLSKSLAKPAEYRDYSSDIFPEKENRQRTVKIVVGDTSPVSIDTEGIGIQVITLKENYSFTLIENTVYSIYLLKGEVQLNESKLKLNDFAIISDEKNLKIEGEKGVMFFLLSSPKTPTYKTYINS